MFRFFEVVLISADMYVRSDKYRVISREIFVKQSIKKVIYLFFIEVEMIHTIFFFVGCQYRIVMSESE